MKQTLLVMIAFASAGRLLANGTRLPSQDDFVVARGYADVATADNASAVYYNPAGLSQLSAVEFDDGVYVLTPQVSYVSTTGAASSEKPQSFALPYGFVAIPMGSFNGGHVVLGLGAYSPFGLASQWPDTSGFRTLATQNSVTYLTGAVSLAVPIAPTLTIGGSLQYDHQHADLNRGVGIVPGDQFQFDGDGHAYSYNLGILWQPAKEHSFGVNFQSQANFNLNGTVNVSPFGITYAAHGAWVYPEDISVGYSYRPTPDWNFEADWDWTNWAALKTVTFYSAANGATALPFNWQASSYYNFGGTRYWQNGWSLSAGVSISTNSVPESSFNPAVPDVSRVLYNAGPGYTIGHWTFQSVLQFSPTVTRTIAGTAASPAGENANGTYKARLWAIGLDFRYRM
jgi:long-chain fatty acid transport protein